MNIQRIKCAKLWTSTCAISIRTFRNGYSDCFQLLGTFFTAQSIVRQLLKQKTPGSLVLIASVAAHKGNELMPVSAYSATKFAVRGLAAQIAAEYANVGIRCNSISPGYASLMA